jgi:hypothetical protein
MPAGGQAAIEKAIGLGSFVLLVRHADASDDFFVS